MSKQPATPERKRGDRPRAADACSDTCSVHAHGITEIRAEQRTAESERASTAYVDWSTQPPSARPLAAQRGVFSTILFEVLRAHGVSRNRFADMIGVNEKQVRKMLDGRAPVPMATLGVMPIEMALDFMDRVARSRGVRQSLLGEIDRLDKRGLAEVIGRATARLAEGK